MKLFPVYCVCGQLCGVGVKPTPHPLFCKYCWHQLANVGEEVSQGYGDFWKKLQLEIFAIKYRVDGIPNKGVDNHRDESEDKDSQTGCKVWSDDEAS